MRRKQTSPPPPIQLKQALDWLAKPPQEDPLLDLVPLRNHLAGIGLLGLPVLHRMKIYALLQQRAERIDEALTPILLDIKLPLPVHLSTIARSLISLRAELGETWLRVAEEASPEQLGRIHRSKAQVCLQGILNLSRQFIVTSLTAISAPINFWRNAQALYHLAHESVDPTETLPVEMSAIDGRFKAMLALGAAQPEGLAPREIAFLAEYIEAHASVTQIDAIRPDHAEAWFWLDASLDQPPVALARLAPDGGPCLYFRFGELAKVAGEHLDQLSDGVQPLSIGLPLQAAGADYRNALERARQCWSELRQRRFHRRPQALPVEVCTQLSTLWTALETDFREEPDSSEHRLTYSDWLLFNEGPSGYAIAHVEGEFTGIVAGCALGLRTGADAAWQICLVRWARNNSSNHVELGLEVLAPSVKPVRIQALATRHREPPIPALLLPALPGLNRSEAILAARGDFNARPFTLLEEDQAHLHIVECVPQRNLIETSSVEVFEFARNAKAD